MKTEVSKFKTNYKSLCSLAGFPKGYKYKSKDISFEYQGKEERWDEFVEDIILRELSSRYTREELMESIQDPRIQLIISLYKESYEQTDTIH
jgi:hypothetical protein